jgi:ApbE superfamily uncharacterized protein (UPF0280 family)
MADKDVMNFRDRNIYRSITGRKGLRSIEVRHRETDLHIQLASSCKDMKDRISSWVIEARSSIEDYAKAHPEFLTAETPLNVPIIVPSVVKAMSDAGQKAGTGPMAAVAGAIAEYVGKRCFDICGGEVIVENGGDIFCILNSPVTISLWAGNSPFSGRIGVHLDMPDPFGICTSSGTVGHSKSYGDADAVTIMADSAALADAVATMTGNLVRSPKDIDKAMQYARQIEGVWGIVIIRRDKIGAWGTLQLVPL